MNSASKIEASKLQLDLSAGNCRFCLNNLIGPGCPNSDDGPCNKFIDSRSKTATKSKPLSISEDD